MSEYLEITHCRNQRSTPSTWRAGLIALFITLVWLILLGRLMQIQGSQRQLHDAQVDRQSHFTQVVPARPGEILDRSGHVLAMTVTRDSIYAVPCEIDDPWEFVWKISSVLDINADQLYERIIQHPDRQFIWVQRRVEDEMIQQIRKLKLSSRTWGLRREYLRQYPQGRIAAHVLGMRDIDNLGHGGLEQCLDERIRGVDGSRVMTRDARGIVVEVESAGAKTPEHGRTVITTLDVLTQIETERQLQELAQRWKPLGACAIVMEPHHGEVLAMASWPAFDPNLPATVPDDAWRNLAVSAVFEPGSTFKPFVVAWALQHDVLRKDDSIQCFQGAYRMGRRILHDHHAYSTLSVEDVLVKSSNIGMARIAERLGLDTLFEATVSFGFGRLTGIELPGEVRGIVRPRRKWDEYSIGSIPMGQELAVTPLQLIAGHAALANGGRLIRPHLLLDQLSDQFAGSTLSAVSTVEVEGPVESKILDAEIADWIVQKPMKGVVERGTGKSGQVDGLSVFGKTGTAQKTDPDTGGYSDSRHICSFVCGAPAERPEILVLVMVDEPTAAGSHFGGTVAAPAAAGILKFALERMPQLNSRLTIRPEHDLPARIR